MHLDFLVSFWLNTLTINKGGTHHDTGKGNDAIMSPVKTSALAVAGTKPAEDYRIHTVVRGDTLWGIAKSYLANGARYTEIVKLNGLKSSVIYTGQKLKIPQK